MKTETTTSKNLPKDHQCRLCDKYFTLRRNLTRHLKIVHKQITKLEDKVGLHCPLNCKPNFITRNYALLREHVGTFHSLKIECEEKTFFSLEEFSSWKEQVEKQSSCLYIAKTAPKRLSFGQKKTYFVCHRSGLSRPASTGKRNIKSQGSCKVGYHCPSTLNLTEDDGKFHVKLYKTHAGHSLEPKHLKLTKKERTLLAGQISKGVSFGRIIADIRKEMTQDEKPSRMQLLRRKDLHNIKYYFQIDGNNDSSDELDLNEVSESPTVTSIIDGQVSSGNEAVIEKLKLMLELVENSKIDEETYLKVERSLDNSIKLMTEKVNVAEKAQVSKSCSTGSVFSPDSEVGAVTGIQTELKDCSGGENVGSVCNVRDIHLDVVQCTRKEKTVKGNATTSRKHLQGLSFGKTPDKQDKKAMKYKSLQACMDVSLSGISVSAPRRGVMLESSHDDGNVDAANKINDLHLNVFRYVSEKEPDQDGFVSLHNVDLAVPAELESCDSGNVDAANKIHDLHLNVFRCTDLQRIEPPENNDVSLPNVNVAALTRTEVELECSFESGNVHVANTINDLHLNVFRCERKGNPAQDGVSYPNVGVVAPRGSETMLEDFSAGENVDALNNISDLHVNVIQYSRKKKPVRIDALFPEVEPNRRLYQAIVTMPGTKKVSEDSCVVRNVEEPTKINDLHLNVLRCKRKKEAQDQTITLRKRMQSGSSSIRVFALNDNNGETLNKRGDFDKVYGIKL